MRKILETNIPFDYEKNPRDKLGHKKSK
jgi:hypothetical protein